MQRPANAALHKRAPFPSTQLTLRTFEPPRAEEHRDRTELERRGFPNGQLTLANLTPILGYLKSESWALNYQGKVRPEAHSVPRRQP
jgi:hypothetical protein